jgi:enterochelin esterase-like enzyme
LFFCSLTPFPVQYACRNERILRFGAHVCDPNLYLLRKGLRVPLLPAFPTRRRALAIVLCLLTGGAFVIAGQPAMKPLPPIEARIDRVPAASIVQARGQPQTPPVVRSPEPDLLIFRPSAAQAEAQGRIRHADVWSAALDRKLPYLIYLPPRYNETTDRFPVLYMLHGLNNDHHQWRRIGLFDAADQLIRDEEIAPLIIVTPQGDNGYWMNHADDDQRWADYVIADLIPHIDATYRTVADGKHRAIGGLSMGGHGALQLALHHPGTFVAVGGHSPVLRSQSDAFPFFGIGEAYKKRDPLSLVSELGMPVTFALWLDMGTDDRFVHRTIAFHDLLAAQGVPHQWRLNQGDHEETYWSAHVREYLRWYDQALRSGGQHQPALDPDP